MKKTYLALALTAAVLMMQPASASEKTDNPGEFVPVNVGGNIDGVITASDVNGAPIVGNTTGGTNSVPSIPAACHPGENWTTAAGAERVYQFTAGTGANLTFVLASTDTANYDPFLYILGTLGNSADCIIGSDDIPAVTAPAVTFAAFNAGQDYFVYADSFFAADAGSFTLTVTGTLPVSLQEFSID